MTVRPARMECALPKKHNVSLRLNRFTLICAVLLMAGALPAAGKTAPETLRLGPGPHLFIDDYLIAEQSFLTRTINRPAKVPDPIITGG